MPNPPPAETDVLCETCGYILNGLPDGGNCPECGSPVELSIAQRHRTPPVWETPDGSFLTRLLVTTWQVIFVPTAFFRSMTSRADVGPARQFARIHWAIAAVLFGTSAWVHWNFFQRVIVRTNPTLFQNVLLPIALTIATYAAITCTINLATGLTAWEAAYRGMRLPRPVVIRALYYHAAHCLPVGIVTLLTVAGNSLLHQSGRLGPDTVSAYLYILCGEVLVAALYLFATYWIAMRNLMFANR